MTCSFDQQPTSHKQTTEDVELAQELAVDREDYEEYNQSGQQDDYFENELVLAGSNAGDDDENADF